MFPSVSRKTSATTARGLFVAVLLLSSFSLHSQTPEVRAFWADAFGPAFKSSAEVTTFINNVRAAKANSIVPEVRKRGDAYYNGSIYEPRAADISGPTFDPLQDMITKAHDTSGGKQRLDVHAWIVSYKIWGSQNNPPGASTPPHPYNAHPDWLTEDVNGAKWDGTSYSFDPGHPDVQHYTFNVCMDIISRYDVDGFNFDYIRYTGNTWGYHPITVARFNARHGRTGKPASNDPLWRQFRRDQVTALVRKVYLHTMATKPWVKISADTITWGHSGVANESDWYNTSAAWNDVLQDWRGWMEEGILDLNIPMNYYRHHNKTFPTDHATAFTNWMNFAKDNKFNRHVVIGPGTYLNYTSNSITQMRATRGASPSGNFAEGVCAYVYKQMDNQGTSFATFKNYLTNSPNAFDPISPAIFNTTAPIPAMPWKTAPTKGHLMGTVYGNSTNNALDGAVVTVLGSPQRNQTNDATGFFGFVDLSPGTYTVTASFPGYTPVSTNVTITAGNVISNDFILSVQGPPAIFAEPQSQTVYAGGLANFTVSAVGPEPLHYQWRRTGTNLAGENQPTLTFHNVITNNAGGYDVVITNGFGSVTSQVATLSVVVPPPNTRLLPLWSLQSGDRPYLTTDSRQRGLAYNTNSNRLLLVSRVGSAQVYVLDADNGLDLHALDKGEIVAGGYQDFTMQMVGVADDGAIYVGNLTLDSSTTDFKLYRWANDNADTLPAVAFVGNPVPGNAQRWGDTMDVRGSGVNTQILLGSRQGTVAALLTTTDGINFTASPINVTGVSGGNFGLGIAFGAGDTFWGKANGLVPLRQIGFDGAVLRTHGSPEIPNAIAPIGVSAALNLFGGIAIDTPDHFRLYDLTTNNGAPVLIETNAFPTDFDNANGVGSVDFGGDRVYALDCNNGIIALRILPPPQSATLQFDAIDLLPDRRIRLQMSGDPGTYLIERTTDFTNWLELISMTNANGVFEFTDSETNALSRFYRTKPAP